MADETKIDATEAMVADAIAAMEDANVWFAEVFEWNEKRDLARAALVAGLAVAHG
jgi:hypothetical protein